VRRSNKQTEGKHTIGEIERKVLNDMTHSFAKQILAEPTKSSEMRAEHDDERFLEAAAELFKLNGIKRKKYLIFFRSNLFWDEMLQMIFTSPGSNLDI